MDAAMNATAAAMDGTVVPDGMNTSMASMAGHDHILFYCDGSLVTTPGGSWIGHCWPGIIMFVWGLHWTLGTFRNYFDSLRNKNEVFTAQSWLPLIGTPKHLPLEPICKVLLPPIAVALELYFAHAAGWRTLMCPPGTARAGHFFGAHINNWQHAAMYPGFWISGFVDLIALKVDLPKGTTHVFLSMGFFLEALLMGLHKKHFPLDIMVHELMFYAMMATAVCIFIEIIWPHNLLVTCSRLLSIFLQATWFWSVARIMFEHRPAWDVSDGDMAPVGLAPVLFTVEIWMIAVCLFGVFMAFSLFYSSYYGMSTTARDHESLPSSHYEKAGLLSDDDHRDNDKQQRVIPMSLIIKDKY